MLTLTARGTVSDYQDTSALRVTIAALAGVETSAVTISVAAASVIITVNIAVPASTTPTAVHASLSAALTTADAASDKLGITVESVPTLSIAAPTHVPAVAAPPSSPGSPSTSPPPSPVSPPSPTPTLTSAAATDTALLLGVTLSGVALLVLLASAAAVYFRRQRGGEVAKGADASAEALVAP